MTLAFPFRPGVRVVLLSSPGGTLQPEVVLVPVCGCCVQVKDRELERLLRALDSCKAAEAELAVAGGDALEGARRVDADLAAVGVVQLPWDDPALFQSPAGGDGAGP